jgi:hypothetical protein
MKMLTLQCKNNFFISAFKTGFDMTGNPNGRYFGSQIANTTRKIILHAGMVCMTFAMVALTGCSRKQNNDGPQYHTSAEALKDYSSYLSSLTAKKDVDTQELIRLTQEWKSLDENIKSQFFLNAYSDRAGHDDSAYVHTRETITAMLGDLVDTRKRTLSDYIEVVAALRETKHEPRTDSLVASIHHFYDSMAGTPTYGTNNTTTIVRYEQMLSDALSKGLHTKQDVFAFLKAEDKAFRSFLEHLPTLGNISLTTVRDNSSLVMKQIVDLAGEDKKVLTPAEAVTLLTMRNNRRLIQNAQQCVSDIRSGKVGKDDQAPAYLWMLLQPWITFDAYAFSLMSEGQMKAMRSLAKDNPTSIHRLGDPEFPISVEDLPALLMKTFLTMQ